MLIGIAITISVRIIFQAIVPSITSKIVKQRKMPSGKSKTPKKPRLNLINKIGTNIDKYDKNIFVP
jgi:hypothetical protein